MTRHCGPNPSDACDARQLDCAAPATDSGRYEAMWAEALAKAVPSVGMSRICRAAHAPVVCVRVRRRARSVRQWPSCGTATAPLGECEGPRLCSHTRSHTRRRRETCFRASPNERAHACVTASATAGPRLTACARERPWSRRHLTHDRAAAASPCCCPSRAFGSTKSTAQCSVRCSWSAAVACRPSSQTHREAPSTCAPTISRVRSPQLTLYSAGEGPAYCRLLQQLMCPQPVPRSDPRECERRDGAAPGA